MLDDVETLTSNIDRCPRTSQYPAIYLQINHFSRICNFSQKKQIFLQERYFKKNTIYYFKKFQFFYKKIHIFPWEVFSHRFPCYWKSPIFLEKLTDFSQNREFFFIRICLKVRIAPYHFNFSNKGPGQGWPEVWVLK